MCLFLLMALVLEGSANPAGQWKGKGVVDGVAYSITDTRAVFEVGANKWLVTWEPDGAGRLVVKLDFSVGTASGHTSLKHSWSDDGSPFITFGYYTEKAEPNHRWSHSVQIDGNPVLTCRWDNDCRNKTIKQMAGGEKAIFQWGKAKEVYLLRGLRPALDFFYFKAGTERPYP